MTKKISAFLYKWYLMLSGGYFLIFRGEKLLSGRAFFHYWMDKNPAQRIFFLSLPCKKDPFQGKIALPEGKKYRWQWIKYHRKGKEHFLKRKKHRLKCGKYPANQNEHPKNRKQ